MAKNLLQKTTKKAAAKKMTKNRKENSLLFLERVQTN